MRICGLQKLSMVDYPGLLSATVFTGGCNLRCPFCHNAPLVTGLADAPTLRQEEVLDFLATRRGLLDGVVLSGGEPLLHPEAPEFLTQVRALGFSIKVDTNGCYPKALSHILETGLADYVAMDLKNSPARYAETVGVKNFDLAPIHESLHLLKTSGIPYELRTTVVRELHTPEEIRAMGEWAQGASVYCLQRFVDSGNLISPGLHAPSEGEIQALAQAARPWFWQVEIRGI